MPHPFAARENAIVSVRFEVHWRRKMIGQKKAAARKATAKPAVKKAAAKPAAKKATIFEPTGDALFVNSRPKSLRLTSLKNKFALK